MACVGRVLNDTIMVHGSCELLGFPMITKMAMNKEAVISKKFVPVMVE